MIGDDRDAGLAPREAGDFTLPVRQHVDRPVVRVHGRELALPCDDRDPVAVGAPVEPLGVGSAVPHRENALAREPAVIAVVEQPEVGPIFAGFHVRDPSLGPRRGLDRGVDRREVGQQAVVTRLAHVASIHVVDLARPTA